MSEIQNLSEQIDFSNSVYYFKGESGPSVFAGFKGPLVFYKNIRDGYTTREKAEENFKKT